MENLFRFGYIKSLSPPPDQNSEFFMENKDILCGLEILLHQINPLPPELEFLMQQLGNLYGFKTWLHQTRTHP